LTGVYVGSPDGNVYALDAATGAEVWRFSTDGGITSSPVVVEGVVYVGDFNGSSGAVFALEVA